MQQETLHIKDPSEKLLKFLKEQRELKEAKKQELLRAANLFFDDKDCPHCEQDQQQP